MMLYAALLWFYSISSLLAVASVDMWQIRLRCLNEPIDLLYGRWWMVYHLIPGKEPGQVQRDFRAD